MILKENYAKIKYKYNIQFNKRIKEYKNKSNKIIFSCLSKMSCHFACFILE